MNLINRARRTLGLLKCYRGIFDSQDGERVLNDLMRQGFVLRPTHVPKDEAASHKNEGKREMILYIMYMLNVDPEKFLKQVRQQRQEDNANENYFKEPM